MAIILVPAQKGGFPQAQALNETFTDAFRGMDISIAVIDPMYMTGDDLDRILDAVDGIMIPGDNDDVHPALYGEKAKQRTILPEYARSRAECALVHVALQRQIPFFGLCRGGQVAAVALGGALKQHVNGHMGVPIRHSKGYTRFSEIRHDIIIEEDSLLYEIAQTDRVNVNSYHHQAIKESSLPDSLVVVARSEDGVVEAMEYTGESPFFLTIQWHPEKTPDEPLSAAVLQAFSEACHIYERENHPEEYIAAAKAAEARKRK